MLHFLGDILFESDIHWMFPEKSEHSFHALIAFCTSPIILFVMENIQGIHTDPVTGILKFGVYVYIPNVNF